MSISVSTDAVRQIGRPKHYEHRVEDMDVQVSVPLAETHIDQISVAFPWATNGKITDIRGSLLRQYAKPIVLTPINGAEIITIPMAVPVSQASLRFESTSIRIISVTFQALTASETNTTLIEFSRKD